MYRRQDPEIWISKDNLVDRKLYRVMARNFSIAVCRKDSWGFIGRREKFGKVFPFEEYHWDNKYFATVKPLEELPETLPENILNEEYICRCKNCNVILVPKRGDIMSDHTRVHAEDTSCSKPECEKSILNLALLDWLTDMEEKYSTATIDSWKD